MATEIAIVGAGPCGLACAAELARLGVDGWTLYESSETAGGHAGSIVDEAGFTWDYGGHVVFSHYREFDALLDAVMGDEVYEHDRSSFLLVDGRWVPYPFQNNLRHLDSEALLECLLGLIDAPGSKDGANFADWMLATFGAGITDRFMRPYNRKVWVTPPEQMASSWIAERVSVVDYRRALTNVVLGRDDVGWGPNNTFRFPQRGGTGEIYRRVAARLGERVRLGCEVAAVDLEERRLAFADGSDAGFDVLVSTMPLDLLVGAVTSAPREVVEAAARLRHTSVSIVGVGYDAPLRDERSWLYFPGSDVPFYRVTNFAKYSRWNVPDGATDRFCSYMTESAYEPGRTPEPEAIAAEVTDALARVGLVDPDWPVASLTTLDVSYAYPVPTVERDAALSVIQPWLEERRVHSRGRFGAWRYELGNMDHAVKMGIDIARRLADGRPEEIWSV